MKSDPPLPVGCLFLGYLGNLRNTVTYCCLQRSSQTAALQGSSWHQKGISGFEFNTDKQTPK